MSARPEHELWQRLSAAGVTAGDMPDRVEAHAPWYVRLMLGIAGLISALFLLAFVGAAFAFVMQSEIASLVVGSGAIAAAYALFRANPHSDFAAMFALAVSLAGQVLVGWAVFDLFGRSLRGAPPWVVMAVIEAALALAMPNFIHRTASAYAAGVAFALACGAAGISFLGVGAVAAAVAWIWLNEARHGGRHDVLAPLGYGLTIALVQLHVGASARWVLLLAERGADAVRWPWIGEALVTASLLASAWVLLRRGGCAAGEPRTVAALAAVTAVGAASFGAPGIAAGLMIVLLGFANGNRVLTGAGIAALLFYVSRYYYMLDTTLLHKAGVLLATGAVLLVARWLLLTRFMPEEQRNA